MKIAGLQRVSLIDYPGRIAATLFVAGCNLNCGYCHNRWMIDAGRVVEAITVADLLAWLEKRQGLLDAVCISGGEPTLQPDLVPLMRAIKALGFMVKLDTNGTQPERLAEILGAGLADYVAMDLKAPLDTRYQTVAGCRVDLKAIRDSLAVLRGWGGAYELRTTVYPGLDEEGLRDLAMEVQPDERWVLQRYRPVEGVEGQATDETLLHEWAGRLASLAPGVRVRGDE
ncbi:MAG: anaerobic ribonucleoside-triphosphate reductase activating protein [Anaerolineae bacterium]